MTEMLQVTALPGYPEEIGRWLWMMEETRRRTLSFLKEIDQSTLDWQGPDGQENAIGSLLYHLAVVEMSWLHFDLLCVKEFPPEVSSLFRYEPWTDKGMAHIPNLSLAEHLDRLERSRAIFLEAFRGMTLEEWRRIRTPDGEEHVTPEWVVFHLIEHEAGHAAQIGSLRRRAKRYLEQG